MGPRQDCDIGQCPMENMKNPQILFFFLTRRESPGNLRHATATVPFSVD